MGSSPVIIRFRWCRCDTPCSCGYPVGIPLLRSQRRLLLKPITSKVMSSTSLEVAAKVNAVDHRLKLSGLGSVVGAGLVGSKNGLAAFPGIGSRVSGSVFCGV